MRTIQLIAIFSLFSLAGFSQAKLHVEFRVEKQAMSTPMSNLEDAFFMNYYYSKPVNVHFDGSSLEMSYDNGVKFVNKELNEVSHDVETEDEDLVMESYLYTDNANTSDTISVVIDHQVGYIQVVLPTKNSKGEYVGYTSFRQFVKQGSIAMK